MDTPYRLSRLIQELQEEEIRSKRNREIFLALDLNTTNQKLHRMPLSKLAQKIVNIKAEFILIIN